MSYFPLFYPRVPLHFGPVNRKGGGGGGEKGLESIRGEEGWGEVEGVRDR
jgi:hypothetical protein